MLKKMYDKEGKLQQLTESEAFACHSQLANGTNKYFVKSKDGTFLNPYGMWYEEPAKGDVRANYRRKYEFRPVKEECFKLYIHFLETRNATYLRQAERLNNVQ